MSGNIRDFGWLILLIVGAIIQVHIMQELFSVYDMSYKHVVFISCWPIIFFVSFAAVFRSLWKGK
jgi:hypothetical protein